MKFCERFGLTPFEYRALPSHLVQDWVQMTNIEESVAKSNSPKQ